MFPITAYSFIYFLVADTLKNFQYIHAKSAGEHDTDRSTQAFPCYMPYMEKILPLISLIVLIMLSSYSSDSYKAEELPEKESSEITYPGSMD